MNGIFTAVLWENGLGDFYWVEIIYAVVGSFAGLLFALASDKLFDTWQERRRLKTIRNSIKGELMGILADLEQIIEEDNHDLNYLNRMLEAECIVWDSVKNSDIFIELIDFENADNNIFKVVNQFEIDGIKKTVTVCQSAVYASLPAAVSKVRQNSCGVEC